MLVFDGIPAPPSPQHCPPPGPTYSSDPPTPGIHLVLGSTYSSDQPSTQIFSPGSTHSPGSPSSQPKDLELPTDRFTLANFNQLMKVAPDVFSVWSGAMLRVPGVRLLLLTGVTSARVGYTSPSRNLEREMALRGLQVSGAVLPPAGLALP